ncbi:MAG TPA: FAD binding domain-containing protein [Thermodesulfobacteriota bacterium]|nr:FAD binding domain-containing protein [Thermodesulfobacteriota bacterium]
MMRLPRFEHLSPTTVEEACILLDQYGPKARILAGGTDLFVALKLKNILPTHLISLKGIDELKGIHYQDEEGLKIGAMTPLYRVRQSSIVREHYYALAQALSSIGSPQIQRMGTLGGNLCLNTRCYFYNQSSNWRKHRPICLKMGGDICHVIPKGKKCHAVFSADTPPALIALGAKVKLASSKGVRWISVKDLYTGDGKQPISLHPGEILTEIQLPPTTEQLSTYLKYRIRGSIDFPLVSVAAKIAFRRRTDTCYEAKVILNAIGPAPIEVLEAEAFFKNSLLTHETIRKASEMAVAAAHPVANIDSTPTYRRRMAGILTQKALDELIKQRLSLRSG